MKVRVFVRDDISLHLAEGRVWLLLNAVIGGLNDVLLETGCTRVRFDDRFAFGIALLLKGQPQNIHLNAGRDESHD